MERSAKRSVLFLCVFNSARSQMAEGLARSIFGDGIRVQSAGSQPTRVNSIAVEVMDEIGISIADYGSKSVGSIDPEAVTFVITLCAEEVCPVFLGNATRLHWPIDDPARDDPNHSRDEMFNRFRSARDELSRRIQKFAGEQGLL